jgi:hypothetical protein
MPESALEMLAPESRAAIGELGRVDVVAGIHALNRAAAIAPLLDAVESGLAKHGASQRVAVLVADCGSHDDTADVLRTWSGAAPRAAARRAIAVAPPRHAGRVLHALLAAARGLGARRIAVLDADMTGLHVDAVTALLAPVMDDTADFVSPAYSRSIAEGTLTTNLLAPLTRALYGKRIQQVTGGCAALSASFADHCVETGIGADRQHAHGIEIALTTTAVATGARVAEAHLGRRVVDPTLPQVDLATTLVRTVGPVFDLMETYRDAWDQARGSVAVASAGDAPAMVPDAARPSIERMVHAASA